MFYFVDSKSRGSSTNINKRGSIILDGDSSDSDVSDDVKLGHLIEEEAVEVGSVPVNTYLVYIKYAGGYGVALIALLFFVINVGSTGTYYFTLRFRRREIIIFYFYVAMSSWWLAHWLNSGAVVRHKRIFKNENYVVIRVIYRTRQGSSAMKLKHS